MGSSAQSTETKSQTSQADNRVVLGNNATQLGMGAQSNSNNTTKNDTSFQVNDSSVHDLSTHNSNSFQVNDSSVHDLSTHNAFTDNSAHDSSTHSNYSFTGTDGGAVQIAGFNSQLLKSMSQNQGDTVQFLAQMGADGIAKQAGAATDLFATSSTNATAAWGHTVDASATLIDHLLSTAQGTVAGANAVASQAVASFTPTANKNADTMKYAAIAAAVLVAMKLFKG